MRKILVLVLVLFLGGLGFGNDAINKRVAELLSKMTVEEKIGQMTQVDSSYLKNKQDVKNYFIGSVLSGGNSWPNNSAGTISANDWADFIDSYQNEALNTRLAIPLLYGIDAVHGNSKLSGSVIFPHNIALGCTRNAALVEKIARVTAIETAASGANWAFAPCIAIARDERWGRTYESYSEDPDLVTLLGVSAMNGLQGTNISDLDSVLACPKHFLADGGTLFRSGINGGLDQGNAQGTDKEMRSIYLKPYVAAVKAGAKSIMASFSSWNGLKMHGNKALLTGVLKNELKFDGFIVSDWKAIDQLPGLYEEQVQASINAGIDMVMVPDSYVKFIDAMKKNVESGKISKQRLDDAVSRILKVKLEMGLFEHPKANRSLIKKVGSPEHRELARQAVRESIVLLKNENNVLPFSKTLKNIVVVGAKADDIGSQCGGWTIDWQGRTGPITKGTTILEGIKKAAKGIKVSYSANASWLPKEAELCVAVLGEKPYAEFMGDRQMPSIDYEDLAVLSKATDMNKPIILILVTGRPVLINDYLSSVSAVVAAWLPGTEGEGVADVLFGSYKPTGKLSFTWPKDQTQLPINVGDKTYDPLFPYGFGLTY